MENQPKPLPPQRSPLMPVSSLFKKSFEIYQEKFWILIELLSINYLAFLCAIPFVVLAFLRPRFILFFILAAVGVILAIAVSFLVKVSWIVVIKERNENKKIKQYL